MVAGLCLAIAHGAGAPTIPPPALPEREEPWHPVRVTVYHPTGRPTASGDLIPRDYSRATHGWVAVSRDLLDRFPLNSTIVLRGVSGEVDGEYVVKDKTHRRIRNTVDILVRPSSPLYGAWVAQARAGGQEGRGTESETETQKERSTL